MPAAPPGTTIQFVSDQDGNGITITIVYDPSTGNFTTSPAISVVSTFPSAIPLLVTGPDQTVHSISIPRGTTNVTPAQLAANGVTNHSQLVGCTLAL